MSPASSSSSSFSSSSSSASSQSLWRTAQGERRGPPSPVPGEDSQAEFHAKRSRVDEALDEAEAPPTPPGPLLSQVPLMSPPSGPYGPAAPGPEAVAEAAGDAAAAEAAPAAADVEDHPAAPGIADDEHNTAVDVLFGEQRIISRACLVARDTDLGDDMGPVLTCGPDDGFTGLFTTQIGCAMALVMLPPAGADGTVYMRHAAVTGAGLALVAAHMVESYETDTGEAGRFIVAYATNPIWDDLNAHRLEQQAMGVPLNACIDELITGLGLDLPLTQAAESVPGSAPPVPEGERFRQVCEAAAAAHAQRAEALAQALGGQAVALPTPAVFATWRGDLVQFAAMPDHEPAAHAAPPVPVPVPVPVPARFVG